MNVLRPNPFGRILFPFLIGIILSTIVNVDLSVVWIGWILSIPLLFALHRLSRSKSKVPRFYFSGVFYLLMVLSGLALSQAESQRTTQTLDYLCERYFNVIKPAFFVVNSDPQIKNTLQLFQVELLLEDSPSISGAALCSDTSLEIKRGDTIFSLIPDIQAIDGPRNPGEFDFRSYSYGKGQYFRAFLGSESIYVFKSKTRRFDFKAIRLWAKGVFENRLQGQSSATAQALVLGDKSELERETKEAYSTSGAMHVLAVSGLHVGLIYLFLARLFFFMDRFRYGRIIRVLLIVLGIFSYAAITGFSPSVTRASIMFAIFAIGRILYRSGSVFNVVFISAFILLVSKPSLLFDLSFQLSYSAVLGILYLYPRLEKLFIPQHLLLQKIWQLLCLSLSAQIATFPIALFYFGVFPSWFLLTNLIVVPAASLELGGGIVLLLAELFGLAQYFAPVYQLLLNSVNQIVSAISHLPPGGVLWKIDGVQLILLYSAITSLVISLQNFSRSSLRVFMLLVIGLLGYDTLRNMDSFRDYGVILFANREPALMIYSGKKACLWSTDRELKQTKFLRYVLEPALREKAIELCEKRLLEEGQTNHMYFDWSGRRIVFPVNLNQTSFMVDCDLVFLTPSTKHELNGIKDSPSKAQLWESWDRGALVLAANN